MNHDVIAAAGLTRVGDLYLAPSASQALRAAGLTTPEEFRSAVEESQLVTRGDDVTLIRRIERNAGDRNLVAYLKWYAPLPWHRRAFRRLRGRAVSGALAELHHINRLRQSGIEVPQPLAFGQDVPLGPFRSFLLLSSLEHWPTLEEIAHSQRFDAPLSRIDVRRRLIAAVADLARRMHQTNIANPSLYSRHVVVESLEADPIRLGLIDLEDLEVDVRVDDRRRAADLGALALTLQRESVSRTDRVRFVRRYYRSARLDSVGRDLIRRVDAFYEKNRHRRRFRHYSR